MDELDNPHDPTETKSIEHCVSNNKVVAFNYRLCEVLPDGEFSEWMEHTKEGEPLYYLHGFQNVVVGLEQALTGKKKGEKIEITLKPEEAYGQRNPNAIQRVPLKHLQLPNGIKVPRVGGLARVRSDQGWHNVIILKSGKFHADVDFNHPLAGRTLHYEIEVVSIRDASKEEIAQGHAIVPVNY
ncbi:MAG: peptidylprolyl isomerase [Gammaproteobacteria bacterium]|nr:peptidylprolyl isomerase [Gammaproteobacteria bacterium]